MFEEVTVKLTGELWSAFIQKHLPLMTAILWMAYTFNLLGSCVIKPLTPHVPERVFGNQGEPPVESETWGKWRGGWVIQSVFEYYRGR